MKKILSVIGTRPEAIKMAPLILELQNNSNIEHTLCITSQHKEALTDVLNFFDLKADFNLEVMKKDQTLFDITIQILKKIDKVIESVNPDIVLVHGDTTTSFVASLAAFYKRIKIGHIEAGLRTHRKFEPFPEEVNRRIVDVLADYYYAPTKLAKNNLLNEGVKESQIAVTGNTVVDAVNLGLKKIDTTKLSFRKEYENNKHKKIILATTHRRENFGEPLSNICDALEEIVSSNDYHIFCPVHPNPNVKNFIYSRLEDNRNISLVDPLKYPEFLFLMSQSYIIISDSGGIQEEAPSMNKKVVVLRNLTERPEGLKSGHLHIAGTDTKNILKIFNNVVNKIIDKDSNPYGKGDAAIQIMKHLESI